jgi:hypothetical protein
MELEPGINAFRRRDGWASDTLLQMGVTVERVELGNENTNSNSASQL